MICRLSEEIPPLSNTKHHKTVLQRIINSIQRFCIALVTIIFVIQKSQSVANAGTQEAVNGLFVERAQGLNGLLSGLTVGLRLWFSKISGKKWHHENGSNNAEHGKQTWKTIKSWQKGFWHSAHHDGQGQGACSVDHCHQKEHLQCFLGCLADTLALRPRPLLPLDVWILLTYGLQNPRNSQNARLGQSAMLADTLIFLQGFWSSKVVWVQAWSNFRINLHITRQRKRNSYFPNGDVENWRPPGQP